MVWNLSVPWNKEAAKELGLHIIQEGLACCANAVDVLWRMHPDTKRKPRYADEQARVVRFAIETMAWEAVVVKTNICTEAEMSEMMRQVCMKFVENNNTGMPLWSNTGGRRRGRRGRGRGRGREREEQPNVAMYVNRALHLYGELNQMKEGEGFDLDVQARLQGDDAGRSE